MRPLIPSLIAITLVLPSCSQYDGGPPAAPPAVPAANTPRVVDAACGQCILDLPGDGCDLAVRIDSVAYYVDGTGLDDHGDAHAADGFCSVVRQARVTGEVVDGRF